MINRCLTCGHKTLNIKSISVAAYVASAWIFAAAIFMLVLQNRITT